jgi:hypothetical protein
MRQAVLLAVTGNKMVVVCDIMTPIDDQLRVIKKAKVEGFKCDRLEFWDSDGGRRIFRVPQPQSTNQKHPKGQ